MKGSLLGCTLCRSHLILINIHISPHSAVTFSGIKQASKIPFFKNIFNILLVAVTRTFFRYHDYHNYLRHYDPGYQFNISRTKMPSRVAQISYHISEAAKANGIHP
jgi:hypothetical protein